MGRAPISPRRRRSPGRRSVRGPRAIAVRRWAVVAALAVVSGLAVGGLVARAERDRARWGERVPVVVAVRPVAEGEPLAAAVRVASWPSGLVPDGAYPWPAALPEGAVATGPLARGAPITEAGTVAAGSRRSRPLVAVPTPGVRPTVRPGDRVSLWATYDPSLAGSQPSTRRVGGDAVVTSVDEGAVVVAVDRAELAPRSSRPPRWRR